MPDNSSINEIDPLIPILRSQVIPCWERFGMDRLAVTTNTLNQFEASSPDLVHASTKRRIGAKVTARSRRSFNNTSSFLESWPEDDQAVFRYPTLAFINEGWADFHVADYVIHCPQDHFLLFGSGIPRPIGKHPHLESTNADLRSCSVVWFFAPPGTNSVTAYVCHSQHQKHWGDGYRMVHCAEVVQLFKILIKEIEGKSPEREKYVNLMFQVFLQFFLRELLEGRFHREGKASLPNTPKFSTTSIGEAQQYIKTHLNETLTAAKVAEQVYMSRNNFIVHFTRETGQTFHQFVTQQKMEEAGRLLRDGHWSVDWVCRFIGLRHTQFRAQFKKHFGVPPSEFRKRFK